MGIKNLNKLLMDVCPGVFRDEDMDIFSFQKIAVDASLYLYKYKITFGDKIVDAYIDLIIRLREKKIHPVFVFDGTSPPEKAAEKQKRDDNRVKQEGRILALEQDMKKYSDDEEPTQLLLDTYQKIKNPQAIVDVEFDYDEMVAYVDKLKSRIFKINSEDYELLKKTLDAFNIPWLIAPGEAEILCAQLCKQGLVRAVLSSDTDVLAAHCPIMIKEISKEKKFVCVCLEDVLSILKLTAAEFTDLCIMCGTDFNKNIPKIGPKNAYKLILKHRRIEDIPIDTTILNTNRVRELFSHEEWTDKVPFTKPINYTNLENWLSTQETRMQLDTIKNRVN